MKRKKIEKIFKKSIEIYGNEAQSRQAMEECAELIQAVNKMLRYEDRPAEPEYYANYINETEVYEWKEKKAKREKERFKNVINKGDIND